MASRAAILRAARAGAPGAAQPTYPPQGGSPWIGQLPSYSIEPGSGYSRPYGPFLPRPPETFTSGAFGPMAPILPVPVDQPPSGLPRAQPRRWQPYVGYNLPVGEPGTDGYKLASFQTLKTLSETYSILRTCIEIRKNEIRALNWDIVLTPDAEKAYQGDRKAMRDFGERRAQAMRFWRRPDPNYYTFESWLHALTDQVFTIDAMSLYLAPKLARGLGKGLLGSDLDCLWLVNGASVRPLMGLHGEKPAPPAPAYQQFEYGVPRADYTLMLDRRDLEDGEQGELLAEMAGDQMIYHPYLQRPDSPYGFSLTEQALIPIMTGLRRQAMQLDFFTDSTTPRVYISPGDSTLTPNQLREMQDALNAVAGDIAWAFKIQVLPPGSKVMPVKDMSIVDDSDNWIATEVAMVCNISPVELGMIPKISASSSAFAAREMAQASRSIHERTATTPTLSYLTSVPDMILQQVCRQDDMRFVFEGMEATQDQAAQIDMGVKAVQSGIKSIDEVRQQINLPPWGLPETSSPVVFTQMGPIALTGAAQDTASQIREAVTGAHDSARAHQAVESLGRRAAETGQNRRKALPAGTSAQGRLNGTVPERQAHRGGALAPAHALGEGSPGHSGASQPRPKAAAAELEALERHLRKGMPLSEWVPQHLPGLVMASIAEDLGKGLSAGYACKLAAALLPKAEPPQETPQQERDQQDQRVRQLEAQYARELSAALGAAMTAVRALIAAWIAGTLAVTAAVLVSLILGEVRKALEPVLDRLWRDGWAEGEQAAGGTAPADLEAFLAAEGQEWLERIAGSGSEPILAALRGAVASGDPESAVTGIRDVIERNGRTDMIAASELTRAWNAAVLAVMRLLGLTWVRWQTRDDDKVCERCMVNQEASPLPRGALFPSKTKAPPLHPNCVIGSTRVAVPGFVVPADVPHALAFHDPAPAPVHGGNRREPAASAVAVAGRDFGRRNIRAATHRQYVGDLVTIRTASGKELAGTPNHPVATRSGWVSLAELQVGDHVLSSTGPEWVMDAVDPDEDHIPPRIEDVAQSFPVLFGAVPLAAEDFHGDGAGSDVCVVLSDGLLVDDAETSVPEHACQCDLGGRRSPRCRAEFLDAGGPGGELLLSAAAAANGGVSRAGQAAALLSTRLCHPDVHAFAAPAGRDPGLDEAVTDNLPADSDGFCERLFALAAGIALDEVVDVKRDVVSTHVYNLDTVDGWYIGNGIVTHNCRCKLRPARPPKPAVVGKHRKVLRREVGLNGQETWTEQVPAPDVAGGRVFYPHRADGAQYAESVPGAVTGGEPPRWDGSEPFPYVEHAPADDDDAAYGQAGGTGTPPRGYWPAPYMDGWWPQPQGHGTVQPPASAPGARNSRPPNSVGKKKRGPGAAARFLQDTPRADPDVVYRQMRENFPASALGWVKRIKWAGPVDLPPELVDQSGKDKWAASHEHGHVNAIARKLKAGEHVNPGIVVLLDGHNHVREIDGRHRLLAAIKAGKPYKCYVGYLDAANQKAAYDTYHQQFHSGDDPRNKSFTAGNLGLPGNVSGLTPFNLQGAGSAPAAEPHVAGLCVRAADTGRVLMLQRAVTDDDPAAGLWEWPGGHEDTTGGGEPEGLMAAALREFAEETGHSVPAGQVTGSYDSPAGTYRTFILTIGREDDLDLAAPREHDNPDGDAFEACAWWDPALIAANPAVRPELVADFPLLLRALDGTAKSAQTPMLESTPHLLGPHGLWHTPDRHVPFKQKLPDYIENIAAALMRDGHSESEAIALAVAAVRRWSEGRLEWGHGKVTPVVQEAARRALEQWEALRASHH